MVYEVRVERAFKGTLPPVVPVVLPGGQVTFTDGSRATVRAKGFFLPGIGERDVWFLQMADPESSRLAGGQAFAPSYGPLGVYQLRDDGSRVVPRGLYRSHLAKVIFKLNLNATEFLSAVQQAVR